jgi:hypothetical protein
MVAKQAQPKPPGPRLLDRNPRRDEVAALVRELAPTYQLDPELVLAVIQVESNFNTQAVSPKQAQGMMQRIPATAKRFDVADPFDPHQNLGGGIPKAPSSNNPVANPARARQRRDYVLGRMLDLGEISPAEHAAALAHPDRARLHGPALEIEAGYAAEMARQEMVRRFGAEADRAGYRVTTSIQPHLQDAAREALRRTLLAYDQRHGYRGPERHFDLSQPGGRIPCPGSTAWLGPMAWGARAGPRPRVPAGPRRRRWTGSWRVLNRSLDSPPGSCCARGASAPRSMSAGENARFWVARAWPGPAPTGGSTGAAPRRGR